MTRVPDWRKRLQAYVIANAQRQFRPGRWDCALFVAGAVEAMTGVDHARGFRGYRTMAEGRRKLSDKGHEDHVALAGSLLTAIPVLRAMPGDVAVVPAGEGQALGIVQGALIYVVGPGGLGTVPLTDATGAFKV